MLRESSFKQFIFLDTDTLFVQDLLHEPRPDVICAKVVDLANRQHRCPATSSFERHESQTIAFEGPRFDPDTPGSRTVEGVRNRLVKGDDVAGNLRPWVEDITRHQTPFGCRGDEISYECVVTLAPVLMDEHFEAQHDVRSQCLHVGTRHEIEMFEAPVRKVPLVPRDHDGRNVDTKVAREVFHAAEHFMVAAANI